MGETEARELLAGADALGSEADLLAFIEI